MADLTASLESMMAAEERSYLTKMDLRRLDLVAPLLHWLAVSIDVNCSAGVVRRVSPVLLASIALAAVVWHQEMPGGRVEKHLQLLRLRLAH